MISLAHELFMSEHYPVTLRTTEVSFVSCHVLYCGNAQLSPTEILVSLSFSYSEILVFFRD